MNENHLITQCAQLKLYGIQQALQEQFESPKLSDLPFNERLNLILEREVLYKDNRRLANRVIVKCGVWQH